MSKFDIVIMFDFIEHVPRYELTEILQILKFCLSEKAIIVINTLAYKYDNDVIANGFDERNLIDCYDQSDLIPETKGMHCNKYSLVSLSQYMKSCGFFNITLAHYFVVSKKSQFLRSSYAYEWYVYKNDNYPLLGDYEEDIIEYPYPQEDIKYIRFCTNSLENISLKLKDSYRQLVFKNDEYDSEMFNDFKQMSSKDLIVFDVGGFMGVSALLFAKYSSLNSKIISFEPNPYNYNRMLDNFSINSLLGWKMKIQLSDYALSSENGFIDMLISPNVDCGYSATSRIEYSHAKIANNNLPEGFFNLNVPTITLDNFVKQTGIIPNVIKVDIEGAEYLLLSGAVETIQKYHPQFYIEFHSEYCSVQCTKILISYGYFIDILHEESDGRVLIKAVYNSSNKNTKLLTENYFFQNKMDALLIKSLNYEKKMDTIILHQNMLIKINENIQNELRIQNEKLETANENINIYNNKFNRLINAIAWFIPIKKWRNDFRKKFE